MLRTKLRAALSCAGAALSIATSACSDKAQNATVAELDAAGARHEPALPKLSPNEPAPSALREPVELWRDGQPADKVDAQGPEATKYVFLDLGEGWTPILFSDGTGPDGAPVPHKFSPTYVALARGEFPNNPYGERAKQDKYLELYGIMPTLGALRARLKWARELACSKQLDLTALANFSGSVSYENPVAALRRRARYLAADKLVQHLLAAQGRADPSELKIDRLREKEKAQVRFYLQERDDYLAIRAAQERLLCEGYFKGKGKWVKGAFDWPTHEALAEFERRHRVYSWGAIGGQTIAALRMDTAQAEHEAVVRVLTERAMHAFGAIEDGSAKQPDGTPATYEGADGNQHEVPNLEAELRQAVIQAFGLRDPEATYAFLSGLGKLARNGHRYVAISGPARPEYYASDMELSVVIDRGDVWYEFPFDEYGKDRPQPVARRPHTNLFVTYLGQRIPLARFGTTIGGWKSELIEDVVWWKYKGSPFGEVLWKDVVSAPVWLPPDSTPPRDLLKRREKRKPGEPKWEVNYHETGPSYASAYGLVAAYHRQYRNQPDGGVQLTADEGIRSHGSVDYMSIMRRHSHGCHRLHNHIAVRLFSFVVSHRPHVRAGHQPTNFVMELDYEEEHHRIDLKQGGYVFKLERPIFVTVEEGRIRGKVGQPIEAPIPKFNNVCKAYYLPDGGAVLPKPNGELVPSAAPLNCDAGLALPPPPPPPEGELAPVAESVPGEQNLVNAPLAPAAQTPAGELLGPATP